MGAPVDYAVCIALLLGVGLFRALGLPWWAAFLAMFVVGVIVVVGGALWVRHVLRF